MQDRVTDRRRVVFPGTDLDLRCVLHALDEEVIDQDRQLVGLEINEVKAFLHLLLFRQFVAELRRRLDGCHRCLDIVGKLGHHVLLRVVGGFFRRAGFPKLAAHQVEGFGEVTEDMALVHLKRHVQIPSGHALGKSGELVKGLDNGLFEIKHIADDQGSLQDRAQKNGSRNVPLPLLDFVLGIVVDQYLCHDRLPCIHFRIRIRNLNIQDRVVISYRLVDAGGDPLPILIKEFALHGDHGVLQSRRIRPGVSEVLLDGLDAVVDRHGILLHLLGFS